MALIDIYQQETLQQILAQEWEPDNRAVWEDGTPIMTKRIFGVVNRYDLSKEFPAPTLRPVPLKTCFDEVDWIYRQRSNNVNDFRGKIWNAWANEEGSIGRAYGYQVAKPVGGYDNQMDYVLGEIKRNPTSRRLVIEMWNVDDLDKMNLPPCAHHLQFVIKSGKVNLILKQRSQDFCVANGFNIVEYAILVHMVARHTGYGAGELIHIIGDCHIYNKHEEQALELVSREPFPAPTLWINPDVSNFYDFTREDFCLENYEKHGQLKMEVAI
ncbi:thymidylate synthase [Cytobacillus oceanisediminis]|uniref:thymidylate synthase n=1 Tax=Cytobacillus oceanisediminis TaxID=665099 RepID=UPI001FB43D58|nr:thymidylate synthase [Cytobacillus oceanisediminis]UOE58175.1 thymidylate synthase [Cytobacillus oceanisediminis]